MIEGSFADREWNCPMLYNWEQRRIFETTLIGKNVNCFAEREALKVQVKFCVSDGDSTPTFITHYL